MAYAFPSDLAEQVVARWRTFVGRHDQPAPPLPSLDQLRRILETAFFASFAREEGRDLRFVLCCGPASAVAREGTGEPVPALTFPETLPLSVSALRSLAPAVSPANAAIMLRYDENGGADALRLAGVLHVGSILARARRGRTIYHRTAPYALLIDVRDAGELHIYRGGLKLATLQAGSLQDQLAFSEIEFLPISDLLSRGLQTLRPKIPTPRFEPAREASDFEWTALLNTVLSVVNGLQEHGHGGALLLVAPGAEGTLPVRFKFDVEPRIDMLGDRFVTFVRSRHDRVDFQFAQRGGEVALSPDTALHLEEASFLAEEDLADAADLVAHLSAVDGALVMTADLRVLGFGAEIVLDAARPVVAYEVSGPLQRPETWPVVDSESFGMRHRSALRCVAVAEAAAAFVVSQDGTVSFFWKQDGRVLLKRGVTTANPNLTGV